MKVSHYYEDNSLYITKENWDELKKDKDCIAFHGVIAAARETISRNGSFIVYRESDTAIMRKCDRLSELDAEVAK